VKVSLGKKGQGLGRCNARVTFGEGESAYSVTLSSLKVVDGGEGKIRGRPGSEVQRGLRPFLLPQQALEDAVTKTVLETYEKEVKAGKGSDLRPPGALYPATL